MLFHWWHNNTFTVTCSRNDFDNHLLAWANQWRTTIGMQQVGNLKIQDLREDNILALSGGTFRIFLTDEGESLGRDIVVKEDNDRSVHGIYESKSAEHVASDALAGNSSERRATQRA